MVVASTSPFCHVLRRWRLAAGLSQEALAQRAGLGTNTIRNLERGVRGAPRPDTLARLADALGLTPEERLVLVAAARPELGSERPDPLPNDGASHPAPAPPLQLVPRPALRLPQLPEPLTSLVGRDREQSAVAALVRDGNARLVTLTGPGGVGKTRLALAVATELRGDFPDGVAFVPLAPVRDPDVVATTLLQALGLKQASDRGPETLLAAELRGRHLLLVLDNFEQVPQAAPCVAGLLEACPNLTAIVTSREPLRLRGERRFPVPPLAVPGMSEPTIDTIERTPAAALFVARAREVDPDFALTDANVRPVAEICRRLDGVPLAIELAAARVAHVPPDALLLRLERRLPVLTGGARDLPVRLRTMRDAIGWSYDLLCPDEQAFFRRLGAFVGGYTLAAAEHVSLAPSRTLDLLGSLVDKSLVRRETSRNGDPRFSLLETVREFAIEQLAAFGEDKVARTAHATCFLEFAKDADSRLHGPDQLAELERLDYELGNFRAALDWSVQRQDAELGHRLFCSLWYFFGMRGLFAEGSRWGDQVLALNGDAWPQPRGCALTGQSLLVLNLGDISRARTLAEEGLATARLAGDARYECEALCMIGNAAAVAGDLAHARARYRELLERAQSVGERRLESFAVGNLGYLAFRDGKYEEAAGAYASMTELARKAGNPADIANAVEALGMSLARLGDVRQAALHVQESFAIAKEVRHAACTAGRLWDIGELALLARQPGTAARLFGAEATLRESEGLFVDGWGLAESERIAGVARAALGKEAYAAAFAAGAALTPADATSEADAALETILSITAEPTPREQPGPGGLSPRELEVLRLVAADRTDRQIAAELFVARRTVTSHVTSILNKLGVDSRTGAAALAVRRGWV